MMTYIRACGVAATLAIAGTVGGQATCSTCGPPAPISSLFGSIFALGNIGNGISDCGLSGSMQNLTASYGPVTSTNSVSATMGGGPYTGISSARSSYGTLSVATHGNNLGVSSPSGYSESGGFSISNEQLTFTTPHKQMAGAVASFTRSPSVAP